MLRRLGLGPVFVYDCLTGSRRWQVYAGRSILAFGLLAGLWVVWLSHVRGHQLSTMSELAQIGHAFFWAIMGVELSLVLLVSPAAAVGALCQDKARGNLTLLMTTHLSDVEIVLGKLAARLVTVLGIVVCALPVQALITFLGGVDPVAILCGSLVIVGVAVLGVCVAMTFSVWATKPHEALMATYAVWAVWLLALLVTQEAIGGGWSPWLERWNPFWLIFTDTRRTRLDIFSQDLAFLAGALLLSVVLAAISINRLRPVTLRQSERRKRRARRARRPAAAWKRRLNLAAPLLDENPVLWREWHRKQSSAWSRAIWRLYALLCILFSLMAIPNHYIAPGVNGFQISIGLLLASIGAATALAEERVQGSLDVVLATPLSTREIVLGKWWGAFRPIPWLAILPTLVLLALGLFRLWPGGIVRAPLVGTLVLTYGAIVTSLGLFFATWQSRLGRAVALNVSTLLAVTVVWPSIFLASNLNPFVHFLLYAPSPFFGGFFPTAEGYVPPNMEVPTPPFLVIMILMNLVIGVGLLGLTLLSFDRRVGRIAELGWVPRRVRSRSASKVRDTSMVAGR